MIKYHQDFTKNNPEVPIVDPYENQMLMVKRDSMEVIFRQLSLISELNVQNPKAFILEDVNDLSGLDGFKYPFICKTINASGGLQSHEMSIIHKPEQLSLISYRPIFVQEFFNHQATIIKVYVCGSKTWSVRRKSIKNFGDTNDSQEPIFFNSQDLKDELPLPLSCDYSGTFPIPEHHVIQSISNSLSDLLGMTMFGFDLINNIKTEKWAVIDINYFPDYRGVEDFFGALKTHLLNILNKNK